MNGVGTLALSVLLAYLVGAIPFGYLVARWRGVDITRHGSGNIGATNVGRVLGKRLGIVVFVLDFAKGALPTAGAWQLVRGWPAATRGELGPDFLPVAAGLAAFLGHMFPVYLRFKGGKGVATGAGVVVVLLPLEALAALLAWVATLCAFRYVSLASVTAAVVLCVSRLLLAAAPFTAPNLVLTGFCLVAAVLVVVRHHANIARLIRGTENRLQDTPAMLNFTGTVHVVVMGLWFGTVVFFTVVALSLLTTLDGLSVEQPRPVWFPLPGGFEKPRPSPTFPEPLRLEQGRRLFGSAVAPLFTWYFAVQTVCGLLAFATAWRWSRNSAAKVHRIRTLVLGVAVLTVAAGWWLDWEVNRRREPRAVASDKVLIELAGQSTVAEDLVRQADLARQDFQHWHNISMAANLATLVLVTIGMVLAAQLPKAETPMGNAETKVEKPEDE
jgi:acyl-phosphate glycerol 3-phosphate acyltransferase